jgi:hypothetical protein
LLQKYLQNKYQIGNKRSEHINTEVSIQQKKKTKKKEGK